MIIVNFILILEMIVELLIRIVEYQNNLISTFFVQEVNCLGTIQFSLQTVMYHGCHASSLINFYRRKTPE